ncbi:MAG: competence/damage-inducible protein A [Oscillospiraceae bacterium]
MKHQVEVIAVGTELLLGDIVNTDAQFLSRELSALGLDVLYQSVVGDNPGRLFSSLAIARHRADILITTGGLGPTCDDLTKQVLCRAFGRELTLHPDILAGIAAFYRDDLRTEMPENAASQAMLPEGCTVLDNPAGTAPGCAFFADGIHVVMLPGPPSECRAVWEAGGRAYLAALSQETMVSHDLRVFGMGEAQVEERLRPLMLRLENPTLAPYAKPAEMFLRVTAKAESREAAEVLMQPVLEEVRAVLGDVIYGMDTDSLPALCLALLQEKQLTFATAESCTGGGIAAAITDLPGASAVYRGGVVSYWSTVKAEVLGVPQALLDTYGAVSEPVALSMAEGARRITGADLAVSATGVAGPDSDERGNEVGTVFVALATPTGSFCRHLTFGRERARIRAHAVSTAFDLLRRYLTGLPL